MRMRMGRCFNIGPDWIFVIGYGFEGESECRKGGGGEYYEANEPKPPNSNPSYSSYCFIFN